LLRRHVGVVQMCEFTVEHDWGDNSLLADRSALELMSRQVSTLKDEDPSPTSLCLSSLHLETLRIVAALDFRRTDLK